MKQVKLNKTDYALKVARKTKMSAISCSRFCNGKVNLLTRRPLLPPLVHSLIIGLLLLLLIFLLFFFFFLRLTQLVGTPQKPGPNIWHDIMVDFFFKLPPRVVPSFSQLSILQLN